MKYGNLNDLNGLLSGVTNQKIFVLVDENTRQFCLPIIDKLLTNFPYSVIDIAHGEKNKNLDSCALIWNALIEKNADRNALIINLGGGVISDMGGFAASTYKRGIDFINIPTTLMAMVDAAIGGKTGVNFKNLKNSIGVFNPPLSTLIDPIFLSSLPLREIKSGWAEIIKHALIADFDHFIQLTKIKQIDQLTTQDWSEIIQKSISIKRDITMKDPNEKGLRKILNFGHTIGHAIESYALDNGIDLLHGEAIAYGMIIESKYSTEYASLKQEEFQLIESYIDSLYHDSNSICKLLDENEWKKYTIHDKKNYNSKVSYSLLTTIGEASYDNCID